VTDQESQRRDLPFDEKPLDLMSPAPAMAEALANDSGFFRSPQGASVDHELDSAACAEADVAASPAGEAGQAQRKSRDWLMLVASKDANAIAAERPNRAGVQTPHEYPVSVDASVAGAQRARISPFGALAAASAVTLVGMGLYYFATDPARHNPRHQSAGIPDTRAPFDLATAEKARSDDHGTTLGREAIVGVSEVIDTGTLRISGKVVSLFGVQWVRGGQATDLAEYLRGRQVTCRPAPVTGTYRCYVEGRDLSQVVLFNGGGRATPEATPDLVAAEGHARAQRLGVWHK